MSGPCGHYRSKGVAQACPMHWVGPEQHDGLSAHAMPWAIHGAWPICQSIILRNSYLSLEELSFPTFWLMFEICTKTPPTVGTHTQTLIYFSVSPCSPSPRYRLSAGTPWPRAPSFAPNLSALPAQLYASAAGTTCCRPPTPSAASVATLRPHPHLYFTTSL